MKIRKKEILCKSIELDDGTAVEVSLDRESGFFRADVLGSRIEATSLGELRDTVTRLWRENVALSWRKVIVINMQTDSAYWFQKDGVVFLYKVKEISEIAGHVLIRDKTRASGMTRATGPMVTNEAIGFFCLPWTAELEQACVDLLAGLQTLKMNVVTLLRHSEGVERFPAWIANVFANAKIRPKTFQECTVESADVECAPGDHCDSCPANPYLANPPAPAPEKG